MLVDEHSAMLIQSRDFSAAQLQRFTELQAQVSATLVDISQALKPGQSEREVTKKLHGAFKQRFKLDSYFHVPVALFGERTAYPGDFGQLEALPTDRLLQDGDAVVLDSAPVIEGYTIDCSYAVQPSKASPARKAFDDGDALLRELRMLILQRAKARANMRDIAREVDAAITAAGFENCHRKHIAKVLGHRVTCVPGTWTAKRRLWGINAVAAAWFVTTSLKASRGHPEATPNWNHTRQSDVAMQPGLWAVEPHVARDGVGVKFEEMLLVAEGEVRFLSDELPHMRR
jgi:Xaa-Pro aminopeptidase